MARKSSASTCCYDEAEGYVPVCCSSSRRGAAMIIILLACEIRRAVGAETAAIRIGDEPKEPRTVTTRTETSAVPKRVDASRRFLVDWGQRSPLYPAAAAAAAKGAAEALGRSRVFSSVGGDIDIAVEWVWHDSACDTEKASQAAEVLLDDYSVDVIVGPACCRAAAIASVVAHRRGVPVISWACSAGYLSDRALFPSLLRVVGSNDDFAAAVGALFQHHGWAGASILYAYGSTRGVTHFAEAWQIRRVLEKLQVSIGAWEGFDGVEACTTSAGGALGACRAVEAARNAGDRVIIVAGECADYRQVMTHAASIGLRSGRAWLLLGGARDPDCHVSTATCGRDDGQDALALSSISGALSIDWSSSSTSRSNAAAYAAASATYNRESFVAEFSPPPAGNASPTRAFCSSANSGGEVSSHGGCCLRPPSSPEKRSSFFISRLGAVADGGGDVGVSLSGGGFRKSEGVFLRATGSEEANRFYDTEQTYGGQQEYRGDDVSHDTNINGDVSPGYSSAHASKENGRGEGTPAGGNNDRLLAARQRRKSYADGEYRSVPAGAPAGVLQSAALMFDAVELGGRLLVAMAESGEEQVRQSPGGWARLASTVEFEGLSGRVKMDSSGNRRGMDISFWLIEAEAVDGRSYTSGKEAARFTHATGRVQLLQDVDWPAAQNQTKLLHPWGVNPWDCRTFDALLLGLALLTAAALGAALHWEIRRRHWQQQLLLQQNGIRPPFDVHERGYAGQAGGSRPAADPPCTSRNSSFSIDRVSMSSHGGSHLSSVAGHNSCGAAALSRATPPKGSARSVSRGGSVYSPKSDSYSHATRRGDSSMLSISARGRMSRSAYGVLPSRFGSAAGVGEVTYAAPATPAHSSRNPLFSATSDLSSHPNLVLPAPHPWSDTIPRRKGNLEAAPAEAWGSGASLSSLQSGTGLRKGGSREADEKEAYNLGAFAPLSEERLAIIRDEMTKISDRAKRALEEVEVDDDEISVGAIMGSGSFAEVRKAWFKRAHPESDGSTIDTKTATTVLRRARGTSSVVPSIAVKVLRDVKRKTLRRFWDEVLIMKDLDHPNIIRLLGAAWGGRRLMMVVEHVSRGNLSSVLEEEPELTWKDHKLNMCLDIARGMAYLHSFMYFDELSNSTQNCVIHRDLKPENLLVTQDFRIKITDFGEATGKGNHGAHTQVGTLLYIAPEIIRGDRYDERCDVYSFAIVLLAMLQLKDEVIAYFAEEIRRRKKKTRRRKDEQAESRETFTHVTITNSIVNNDLRPRLPKEVHETLKILMKQCWSPAPAMRPTFDEIMEFLEEIAKEEIVNGQSVEENSDTNLSGMNLEHSDTEESTNGQTVVAAPKAAAPGTIRTPGVADAVRLALENTADIRQRAKWPEAEAHRKIAQLTRTLPPHKLPTAPMGWGKKRGKNYRPTKGIMAKEFLGKHREFYSWKTDPAPYTIFEDKQRSDGSDKSASVPEIAMLSKVEEMIGAFASSHSIGAPPTVAGALLGTGHFRGPRLRRLAGQGGTSACSRSFEKEDKGFEEQKGERRTGKAGSTRGSLEGNILENEGACSVMPPEQIIHSTGALVAATTLHPFPTGNLLDGYWDESLSSYGLASSESVRLVSESLDWSFYNSGEMPSVGNQATVTASSSPGANATSSGSIYSPHPRFRGRPEARHSAAAPVPAPQQIEVITGARRRNYRSISREVNKEQMYDLGVIEEVGGARKPADSGELSDKEKGTTAPASKGWGTKPSPCSGASEESFQAPHKSQGPKQGPLSNVSGGVKVDVKGAMSLLLSNASSREDKQGSGETSRMGSSQEEARRGLGLYNENKVKEVAVGAMRPKTQGEGRDSGPKACAPPAPGKPPSGVPHSRSGNFYGGGRS